MSDEIAASVAKQKGKSGPVEHETIEAGVPAGDDRARDEKGRFASKEEKSDMVAPASGKGTQRASLKVLGWRQALKITIKVLPSEAPEVG